MTLREKIEENLQGALRNRQPVELGVLRMLKAALMNKAIEKMSDLTDEDVVTAIRSEVKKRRESVEAYELGGRIEQSEKEKIEIKILEAYLPAQMDAETVRSRVQAILATLSAEEKVNVGQVIGRVMSDLRGQADGSLVNQVVRELLG
jgi:uncharacterized protein